MLKVLVTGGAGFIGSHVVEELLRKCHEVVVLDDLSTGKFENLPEEGKAIRIVVGSILDQAAVREAIRGCDAVIHLAAIASVQASVENPILTHQVNFVGTLHLLEEARRAGIRRLLYASSAAVYGNSPNGAISENSPLCPLTPYASDKVAGEYYLDHYHRTFEIQHTSFRFFNVYGPRQDPNSPYSGVISIFASSGMTGKRLRIFGDGKQTRDFVYVKDVARLLVASLGNEDMFGKTINVGTGEGTSLLELVGKLGEILDRPLYVEHADTRVGDIRHSLADISLLRSLGLGQNATSIADGLRATIGK